MFGSFQISQWRTRLPKCSGQFADVPQPRPPVASLLLKGTQPTADSCVRTRSVQAVSVAEVEPRLNADAEQVIHYRVEPGEFVLVPGLSRCAPTRSGSAPTSLRGTARCGYVRSGSNILRSSVSKPMERGEEAMDFDVRVFSFPMRGVCASAAAAAGSCRTVRRSMGFIGLLGARALADHLEPPPDSHSVMRSAKQPKTSRASHRQRESSATMTMVPARRFPIARPPQKTRKDPTK